ncbi:MAG: UvrD-helicase domain-containing protein [Planctomycetota bacterium]
MSKAAEFLSGGGEARDAFAGGDPFAGADGGADVGGDEAGGGGPADHAADQAGGAAALLEGLTDDQRRAAETTEGPVLVLAAAGSGKTRVITRRIGFLVENGIPPWQILALTFTNKAAGEMRERVNELLAPGEAMGESRRTRGLTVTTFHSLCARLLRRYAERAGIPGLKPDYSIYDSADQSSLMKQTLKALDLSTTNWPPRSMLSAISNAKNELMDAEAFERGAGDFASRTVAKVFKRYETGLRKAGAVDFDDLLLLVAKMLRDTEEIRREVQDRYRYLMIDEYQDTNRAQFLIASMIAGTAAERGLPSESGPNICVVGDPDQSIYGWRGADITNILEFEERYPSARTISLGQNFRSTAPILGVADTLIRHNKQRKHKDLYTTAEGGERVGVVLCRDEHHEAELVVDWFKELHEGGEGRFAWKDCAVLYRTNALSRVLEERLLREGVPYVIARGTAFYQREEVKDVLAYLRVVANTADEVNLERVVNKPTRGIGKAGLDAVRSFAASAGLGLFEALRLAGDAPGVSARAANAMKAFAETVDGWNGAGTFMGAGVSGSLAGLVERVIKESGLEGHYKKLAAKNEQDADRLDNLDELISSAAEFEQDYDPADDPMNFEAAVKAGGAAGDGVAISSEEGSGGVADDGAGGGTGGEDGAPPLLELLRAYLESVALVADADSVDPDQGAVTLMTLHAAKGLEFPAAAIVGLEENTLPHSRAQASESELEEERRLAFVGITRAMRHLKLTSARYRTVRGIHERTIPSRFLEELGTEHVSVSDQSDVSGGLGEAWGESGGGSFGGGGGGGFDRRGRMGGGMDLSSEAQVRRTREGDRRASGLALGAKVRHPRFGPGVVKSVTGGANARAQVAFEQVGVKTLVLEYAKLEVLG